VSKDRFEPARSRVDEAASGDGADFAPPLADAPEVPSADGKSAGGFDEEALEGGAAWAVKKWHETTSHP
jgi:hypothetical protein